MSLSLNNEQHESPEQAVRWVESQSTRVTTPCGDGKLVWHIWEGDGPPLVLLHGGYGSWGHWIRNVLPLSRHFRVIAADNPGLGESSRPPAPHTAEGLGRIIVDGLEEILTPGDRPHIVGFSFGAVLGGQVSVMMGERVRSFTLVGAGGLALTRPYTEPLTRWERHMTPEQELAVFRRNLEILMIADPRNVDDLAIYLQSRSTKVAKVKSPRISRTDSLRRALPHVRAPIKGIWGSLDAPAMGYIHEREALLRSVQPDVDFRVVEGAGHWTSYEAADIFNAMLVEMLKP